MQWERFVCITLEVNHIMHFVPQPCVGNNSNVHLLNSIPSFITWKMAANCFSFVWTVCFKCQTCCKTGKNIGNQWTQHERLYSLSCCTGTCTRLLVICCRPAPGLIPVFLSLIPCTVPWFIPLVIPNLWRFQPRLVFPPRSIILPPHVCPVRVIFVSDFVHFSFLAKTFTFTFAFLSFLLALTFDHLPVVAFSFLSFGAIRRNVSEFLAFETFQFWQINITCIWTVLPTATCTTLHSAYSVQIPIPITVTGRHVIMCSWFIRYLYLVHLIQVLHVSILGLQCLESNRLFCNCENCMIISDDFGANLELCQLRNVRLNYFFNSLT